MCGITGIYGLSDKNLIKRMTDTIVHRGPDSGGFYVDNGISLGNRRLSIIDLSRGDQPIFDKNNDNVIIFNGEIYNYRQLRKELIQKGHMFYTDSDTEVVLHTYGEYGLDGIGRLNGMFAFAIFDEKKKTLVLARDRAGIKPLYYALIGKILVFGSEIKCLLEYDEMERRIDERALSSYLTYGTVLGELTLFDGVKKLLPGRALAYDGKTLFERKFPTEWPSPAPDYSPASFRKVLLQAVKNQMVSDVPLGAFLSGGIDSSTIVAMLAQSADKAPETFTVGFGERSDEIVYARAVSEHFGTNHHELIVSPDDVPSIIKKLVWHYDDLTWDSASLPVYMVSELARKFVKVVLTGEGSDELLAGYERYKPFSNYIPLVPSSLRWRVYKRFVTMFDEDTRRRVGSTYNSYAEKILASYEKRPGSALQNVMDFEFDVLLPNQLLNKADKSTMAASIEGRVPFLDNDVLSFAKTVPLEMKLHGLEGKHILREAMADLLPETTRRRMKKGFGAKPLFWFRNKSFREFAISYFDEPHVKNAGLDFSIYKEKLANINRPKVAYQLWALLLLELWYRTFIEGEK